MDDITKPGVFIAPLTVPRSSPQRVVEDRYSLIPQFRIEPGSPRSPESLLAQATADLSGIYALIAALTARVTVLETMIDGASIAAVCNMDGTITVTLTWGS